MSLWKVNCAGMGAYVEGVGVLRTGEVHDIPEFVVVKRHGRDKRIAVTPRLSWIPMDDRSWTRFHEFWGHQKQLDADGRPVLDAEGKEALVRGPDGEPLWVQPYADMTPEPEMTPEEEDAAAEETARREELARARAEAVEEFKRTASPEAKPGPVRHSDHQPPPVSRRG